MAVGNEAALDAALGLGNFYDGFEDGFLMEYQEYYVVACMDKWHEVLQGIEFLIIDEDESHYVPGQIPINDFIEWYDLPGSFRRSTLD